MKYTNHTGLIVGILMLIGLLYSCSVTGLEAIEHESASIDHLRAERSERIYGSLDQYNKFLKEQGQ